MKNIIIYNDENLRVVHCSSAIKEDVIQEADKVVPFAVPYKIIDSSEIPADRIFRNAWEVDNSEITDGVGGELKAKADLSQAEDNLIEQKRYLADKQTKVAICAEELANAKTEAAAVKAAENLKNEKSDLEVIKAECLALEEKRVAAESKVKQCLDALPLDKRST